jgi:hypothetical protein
MIPCCRPCSAAPRPRWARWPDPVCPCRRWPARCRGSGSSRFALVVRVHALVQPGVQLPHDLDGVGMLAFAVLGHLVRMAAGAVLGRNDGGDGHLVLFLTIGQVAAAIVFFVVFGDILIARLGQVAVQAGDVGIGVAAVGPVPEQAGVGLFVAFDAGLGLRRHAALDSVFLDLWQSWAEPWLTAWHCRQHQPRQDQTLPTERSNCVASWYCSFRLNDKNGL